MSIEDKASKIRVLMAEMNLRGNEISKLYGKSQQYISRLKQVDSFERQQDDFIEFLNNLKKDKK